MRHVWYTISDETKASRHIIIITTKLKIIVATNLCTLENNNASELPITFIWLAISNPTVSYAAYAYK